MKKGKHTQGPWVHGFIEDGWGITPRIKIQNRCLLFVLKSDGNILPSKEDAQLIAAAPELLEALKLLVQATAAIHNGENWDSVKLAKRIIAKVEGSLLLELLTAQRTKHETKH